MKFLLSQLQISLWISLLKWIHWDGGANSILSYMWIRIIVINKSKYSTCKYEWRIMNNTRESWPLLEVAPKFHKSHQSCYQSSTMIIPQVPWVFIFTYSTLIPLWILGLTISLFKWIHWDGGANSILSYMWIRITVRNKSKYSTCKYKWRIMNNTRES